MKYGPPLMKRKVPYTRAIGPKMERDRKSFCRLQSRKSRMSPAAMMSAAVAPPAVCANITFLQSRVTASGLG